MRLGGTKEAGGDYIRESLCFVVLNELIRYFSTKRKTNLTKYLSFLCLHFKHRSDLTPEVFEMSYFHPKSHFR